MSASPVQLNLKNIQGNILAGFNKDYQSLLFVRFNNTTKGRAWLANLIPEIANCEEVGAFNQLFKALNRRRGGELGILKATWTNIAFTHSGLKALAVKAADLNKFPDDYKQGMRARASITGDVAESTPGKWVGDFNTDKIHAVLIVASDTQFDLHEQVARYIQNMTYNGGVELVFIQEGAVRQDEPGHEHFGFKDGVSQPGIRGFNEPDDPGNPDQGHPGQDLLHPGEFVLGYPTQAGVGVPPQLDDLNTNPGPPSMSGPAWTTDGSYMVFRRLKQDVRGFHDMIEHEAARLGLTSAQLGAKMVGRYASGAPLEQSDEMKARGIDPNQGDPAAIDASFTTSAKDNDFEYGDDQAGKFVPRAAHIRKTYPRDQDVPGENPTQKHRLLRRGIPFGTSFRPSLGATSHEPEEAFPHDRGLLFIAYQRSISDQFEFVQQTWVNNAGFPGGVAGHDPIIAQKDNPRDFNFTQAGGQVAHIQLMKRFVVTTGGDYFFQPSIKALHLIANVAVPTDL